MTAPRILHITPVDWRNRPWGETRMAELQRIFGENVGVQDLSPVGKSPEELVQAIREARVDAVMMASAERPQVQAVQDLAGEVLVLRPMYRKVRNNRGEPQQQWTGFGRLLRTRPSAHTAR